MKRFGKLILHDCIRETPLLSEEEQYLMYGGDDSDINDSDNDDSDDSDDSDDDDDSGFGGAGATGEWEEDPKWTIITKTVVIKETKISPTNGDIPNDDTQNNDILGDIPFNTVPFTDNFVDTPSNTIPSIDDILGNTTSNTTTTNTSVLSDTTSTTTSNDSTLYQGGFSGGGTYYDSLQPDDDNSEADKTYDLYFREKAPLFGGNELFNESGGTKKRFENDLKKNRVFLITTTNLAVDIYEYPLKALSGWSFLAPIEEKRLKVIENELDAIEKRRIKNGFVADSDQQKLDTFLPEKEGLLETKKVKQQEAKKAAEKTEAEIKKGNVVGHTNLIELEDMDTLRKKMFPIVAKDNGGAGLPDWKGGQRDANNKEYGGVVEFNGNVIESPSGQVTSPLDDSKATITINETANTKSTFHSHPSGYGYKKLDDGRTKSGDYTQGASSQDIEYESQNGKNRLNYVFGRGRNQYLYIYDCRGVVATLPWKVINDWKP